MLLMLASTLLIACTCRYLALSIYGYVSCLTHVAEGAEVESLKLELPVFDAQLLVVCDSLVLLGKQIERRTWIYTDLPAELTGGDTLFNYVFNFPELLLIFNRQLEQILEAEGFL